MTPRGAGGARTTGVGAASGTLVLVATPIGNLGDLSPRAVEVLAGATAVCCEDTRHSGRLLAHAGVRAARLIVVNEHTETEACAEVLGLLASGGDVALVTDAGTPGLSDPGERLVAAAVAAGARVSAVPGPAAAVMALVVSGLPTRRFVFEGFLPRSGAERAERLAEISAERRTVVVYEAPPRVERTLADLAAACGPLRRVAVARELTKRHEEIWRGTLQDAARHAAAYPPRGEHVLVLEPARPPEPPTDAELVDALRAELRGGASRKDAASRVAVRLAAPRRRVYELALRLGESAN